MSRHRVQKQCQIGDIARHRSLNRQRGEKIVRRAPRHPPGRGPQSHHGTIRSRAPQRTAVIGPVRQPNLPRGDGYRAAASRTATGQRGVPWVAGAPENLVEGRAARTELGRVGFGDNNAALALDPFHQRMRRGGHMVLENRRSIGRAHARDVVQILDRHRQPGQPARLVLSLPPTTGHQSPSVVPSTVQAQRRQRIHRRFHSRDALRCGVDQFQRRNLPPLQTDDDFGGSKTDDFVRHRFLHGYIPAQAAPAWEPLNAIGEAQCRKETPKRPNYDPNLQFDD